MQTTGLLCYRGQESLKQNSDQPEKSIEEERGGKNSVIGCAGHNPHFDRPSQWRSHHGKKPQQLAVRLSTQAAHSPMEREIDNGHEADETEQKEEFDCWINQSRGTRGEMISHLAPAKPKTLVRANR